MIPKQPVKARAETILATSVSRYKNRGRWLVVVLAALGLVAATSPAGAQIRGRRPIPQASTPWWFSGGIAALTLRPINDGTTHSKWNFGNDPLWQMRASLEKASDDYTTLGISAGYGRVDVQLETLTQGTPIGAPPVDGAGSSCTSPCKSEVDLWTAQVQFRSGGGNGFHSVFEAQGGVTAFRNLRRKDNKEAVGGKGTQADISGTLGAGFAYTISRGFAIAIVQDFGMGWHSKSNLPDGISRTWKSRTTRASLRFAL